MIKIYWTISAIPEYKAIDKALIKKTWLTSYWKTYRHWQQWIMATLSLSALIYLVDRQSGTFRPYDVVELMICGVIWLLWSQFSIVLARPYIREQLKKEGIQLNNEI